MTWFLPILISLPKRFEPGIEFAPGNGGEIGYICYVTENGKRIVFTKRQWYFNLTTDIMIFIVIIISYLITWCGIEKENEDNRRRIVETRLLGSHQLRLFRYNIYAKSIQKDLRLTASIICLSYIVFRLPLIILGRIESDHILFKFCATLYTVQFFVHFIIYALIQKNYRKAYCDILRVMFPCCFICQRSNNNLNIELEEKYEENS